MPISTTTPQPNGVGSKTKPDLQAIKENATLVRDAILKGPQAPCRVHDFIDHQILIHPKAPAVQFENAEPMTYDQLDLLAIRIANMLDIKPGTIVPICMDISAQFIATILAVLRSGAAYCTLDPSGSQERNNGIVEDCNAGIVVLDQLYAPMFGDRGLAIGLALSGKTENIPEDRAVVETAATDAAYLIYTSGMFVALRIECEF